MVGIVPKPKPEPSEPSHRRHQRRSAKRVSMKDQMRAALESARIAHGLTLAELAALAHIDVDRLRAYETGRDFPQAEHIATLEVHLQQQLLP